MKRRRSRWRRHNPAAATEPKAADFVPLVKEPRPYAELMELYGAHAINRAVARGELMLDFNVEYSPQTLMWTPKQGEGYEPDFIRN